MLHVSSDISDRSVASLILRAREHLLGNIDAKYMRRAVFSRPSAKPSEPASEINNAFSAQVGKHRAQRWPLGRGREAFDGSRQAAVFGEESLVVVNVLRHH